MFKSHTAYGYVQKPDRFLLCSKARREMSMFSEAQDSGAGAPVGKNRHVGSTIRRVYHTCWAGHTLGDKEAFL
jgi:hypothetical protein